MTGNTARNGKTLFRRKRRSKAATSSTNTHPSEHEEQVGFVVWFRARFPAVLIFSIPNGGKRSIATAKKLKAEGLLAGVPDLFVPEWRLWVEMKRVKGGTLSQEQKEMLAYLEAVGYKVIIAKGAREASKKILEFLNAESDPSRVV